MILIAVTAAVAVVAAVVLARRPVVRWWRGLLPADLPIDAELAGELESPDPLIRQVARLTRKVTLADAFNRGLRRMLAAVLAALAIEAVIIVALGAVFLAFRAEVDARERERHDRAVASCITSNIETLATRDGIVAGVEGAIKPFGSFAGSDRLAQALRASTDAALPFRDCSPAGVDSTLAHPPPDPATTTTSSTTTTTEVQSG